MIRTDKQAVFSRYQNLTTAVSNVEGPAAEALYYAFPAFGTAGQTKKLPLTYGKGKFLRRYNYARYAFRIITGSTGTS